ncbi:MAG: DUF4097 family beta strand repeat protein [Gemmatimonadetes bacterium]|nr:DUF4097 family beta strand repeat protein [Gemmatimonadota bacterium]
MRAVAVGFVMVGIGWLLQADPLAAQQDQFHWRGRLAAGETLTIRGVHGDIRALPALGGEAEVSAVKHARRDDPEEVEIEVVPHDGGVTICAVYPAPRRRAPNQCLPGGEGRNHTSNNDVQVDFTVRVPRGVHFTGKTVQGDVTADSLGGNVEAHSVNGDVEVSTTGYAEASSVNGTIRATMGRADWTGSLKFSSVNGGITVVLPADLSAAVEASTVNGSLDSDFPLTVQGRFSARRFRGTIGGGGRELRLETVNGSIRLRRPS